MTSACWTATSGRTSGGQATVTSPAPARSAPRAASTAAPAFPTDPATTRTWPKVPLWAPAGRSGRSRAASAASVQLSAAPSSATTASGIPMSTTDQRPACSPAGSSTRQGLGRQSV
jgi:hypothetical protein